jgi:hypothetical protein
MYPVSLKFLPTLAALLLLCACTTPLPQPDWPAELPARQIFTTVWRSAAVNQTVQSEDDYLLWVRRFYQGYNLVPGWLSMSAQVNERLTPRERAAVARSLRELGSRIGAEWAKDNGVRLVNTRMVAVWRDALLEALAQEDLPAYLERLDADMDAVLNGRLAADEVVFERYYVDEFDF